MGHMPYPHRMPRPTGSIQAEIAALELRLSSADSFVRSAGSDGANLTNEARHDIERRLDQLYTQLDRLSGARPMFTRGRIQGL
jgi:hypothetical protein